MLRARLLLFVAASALVSACALSPTDPTSSRRQVPKAHRDEVNKKVMEEMSESYKDQTDFEMPNDMKKMAYGGFAVVVEG